MDTTILLGLGSTVVLLIILRSRKGRGVLDKKKIPEEELERLYDQMIERVSSGELASLIQSNILLKRDERLVVEIPGVQLCEETTVKVGGTYQGFSVRIMKGVSYRFGGFSAGSEQQVVPIDRGDFTLTNKRFVFAGARRSVECPLSKIISLDVMRDGIVVSRRGKTKTEYYVGTDVVRLQATLKDDLGREVEEEKIEWRLTGEELRRLIQRLLQEE